MVHRRDRRTRRATPTLLVEIPAFETTPRTHRCSCTATSTSAGGGRREQGPWKPVVEDGKLYGRGAADDGYAVFGSLCAIEALQAQGASHPRVTVLIETSEESGSPDLAAYVEHLSARLGSPDLVVCLDSGAGDYERMWLCTSLRGNVTGDLRISTVTEGIHSGDASGIVPSSFRVARILLDRIEDAATGEIVLDALRAAVPDDRMSQARAAAGVLGEGVHDKYPFQEGARPMGEDGVTWIRHLGGDAPVRARRMPSLRTPATSCAPDGPRASARADDGPRRRVSRGRGDAGERSAPRACASRTPTAHRLARAPSPLARGRRGVERHFGKDVQMARAARSRSWACSATSSPARSS